tara:strand:- start:1176 stop:2177 length:1002 start_codon:yes stop_codon:yes gene_type:complete
MGLLKDCINNKETNTIPIWFMRQAGRYLPEFRDIRSKNIDFIKLCLNPDLSKEITLQPLKRFNIDAAIIFSDILLIPYALGQKLKFEKNFGPKLGDLDIERIVNITDQEILEKLEPVYKLVNTTSNDLLLNNKDLIGFIGAPWTLMVYMLNKKSPKRDFNLEIFNNINKNKLLEKIIQTQKLHIKKQVENGASIIQIFDSWAGLLDDKYFSEYIYNPTKELVKYVKSLGVEVICFPRGIKNYKEYSDKIEPNAISIDYEVDPNIITNQINIPIQGGLDPKCLLLDEKEMLNNAKKYLEIFKNRQYIFNLGHGMLPETNPNNVKLLVDFVKSYK